ncbi:GNAT family N-acetyltransferase [Spirosoma soli]|uniref:GNAT family N-acetyltransferase n=1 Tax=Spirosoma soli TaxID=1770529 RepID=A0ABW5MCU4_9BACT
MTIQSTTVNALQIRAAAWKDASVIYSFLCELEEVSLNPTAFRAVFRHNLTNPAVHYLVAELKDSVVGFVSCHVQYLLHHCGKVGEIQELFVKPEYRNQQIGQKLVSALHTVATAEGLINLEVTSNQKRTDTIRFYERESFKRTHVKLVKPL